MNIFAGLLLLLVSGSALGDVEKDALRKNNPNELYSLVTVAAECKIEERLLRETVDGVLVRARLKTGDLFRVEPNDVQDLIMGVQIDCMARHEGTFVFAVDVRFVRPVPELGRLMYEMRTFGNFGVGSPDYILQSTRGAVEDAIKDYLIANFDLAPQ